MSVYNGFSIMEEGKKGVFDSKSGNEGRFPCVLWGIGKEVFLWAIEGGLGIWFLERNDTYI